MISFKVISYNIHFWLSPKAKSNINDVIEIIKAEKPDVIALQEVQGPDPIELNTVAKETRLHRAFADTKLNLANAMLSRFPLATPSSQHNLPRHRNVVKMEIVLENPLVSNRTFPLSIYCIHLDPYTEQTRLEQLKKAIDWIQGQENEKPHIIMGDFNSIRISDYSPTSLKSLGETRKRSNWEEPRNEVVTLMDEEGYVDSYRLHLFRQQQEKKQPEGSSSPSTFSWDDYKDSLTSQNLKRNPKEFETCWAKTRIDFIWLSSSLMKHIVLTRYTVLNRDASDHFPVVCEFDVNLDRED